LSPIFISEL